MCSIADERLPAQLGVLVARRDRAGGVRDGHSPAAGRTGPRVRAVRLLPRVPEQSHLRLDLLGHAAPPPPLTAVLARAQPRPVTLLES